MESVSLVYIPECYYNQTLLFEIISYTNCSSVSFLYFGPYSFICLSLEIDCIPLTGPFQDQHLVAIVKLLIVLYQTRISRAPDRTEDPLPRQRGIYRADVLPIACCRDRFCLEHVDAILKNDFLKFWINIAVILLNTYLQKIHISCQVFKCYQMLHCIF